MNFTAEHIRILEKNRVYYTGLQTNGTLNKMSSVILDEFKLIHKEVISNRKINSWCAACIIELIEIIYANYDKFINDGKLLEQAQRPEQTGNKPALSQVESKGKKADARRNATKNS